MFTGLLIVNILRIYMICVETSRDDEHFTANPISISLLSKTLLRIECMSSIFEHPVFVEPWKSLLSIMPVSGLLLFVSECFNWQNAKTENEM